MRIGKLLILIVAALAGSAVYKLFLAPPAPGESSFYASLTGPGSLMQAYRSARDGNASEGTTPGFGGGIGAVGNPYSKHRAESSSSPPPPPHPPSNDDAKLLQAAAHGDKKTVLARLEKKANADSRDVAGRSALIYAAWAGHDDICARLIAAGADVHLTDRQGYNALDYAAGRGLTGTVQLLLDYAHVRDDNHYKEYAALMQAAYHSTPAALPAGSGTLASINRINPDGQAPLFIAAGNGALPMLEALLARGAKTTLENGDGRTPLHWAAWNNQPAAIDFLIAHGGSVDQADPAGVTALMQAAQHDSRDAAKALLTRGADKYRADNQGKTAAMMAEDSGFKTLAELLK